MNDQLNKMIKMVKIYLKKNGLDGDTSFYTIEDWKKRKEPYLNDSEFVIITEGGLNFILNYGDADEFYELVNSFGYYFEFGYSWNLGFYQYDEEEKQHSISTYSQKLKDGRWQKKRK